MDGASIRPWNSGEIAELEDGSFVATVPITHIDLCLVIIEGGVGQKSVTLICYGLYGKYHWNGVVNASLV